MSELNGQMDLNSFLEQDEEQERIEGYDDEGNLMDVEAGEGDTSSGAARHLPLEGKDFGDEEAQTPADLGDGEGDTSSGAARHLPLKGKAEEALTEEGFEEAEAGDRLRVIAAEVRAIEEQVKGVALSGAVAIGKRLLEAKGLVPHGRFGEWLAANVDYSERRAQDLMRLYETYGRGTIPDSVSALDYSRAVALLSAPEESREQLAEAAADMSVRQLQAEVKRLNAEKVKAQMTIEDLEGKVAGQIEEIQKLDERENTYDAAIKRMESDMRTLRGTADAANRSAEALRKERDEARANADNATRRANDAVNRANETQRGLTEAEARIRALEEREPERVEVVPPEVAAELEQLRGQKPRGEAEVRFRLAFERLGAEFKAVQAILGEVVAEDADKGAKFAAAVVKACEGMIHMLGVEA